MDEYPYEIFLGTLTSTAMASADTEPPEMSALEQSAPPLPEMDTNGSMEQDTKKAKVQESGSASTEERKDASTTSSGVEARASTYTTPYDAPIVIPSTGSYG